VTEAGTLPSDVGLSRFQRRAIWLCIIVSALLAVLVVVHAATAHLVIEPAYRGEAHPLLNRLVRDRTLPIEVYYLKARRLTTRVVILGIAGQAALLLLAFRRQVADFFKQYFSEPDSAFNLAVFRGTVFAALLWLVLRDRDLITTFSAMPDELRYPPLGSGWIVRHLRFDPATTSGLLMILMAACVTGLVGLFSRTSALVAGVLGIFVLGIPQCFGKVNHYHFLIWMALLLSASRCGDALALDTLWRRRGPPDRSAVYGAPLRFAWLLIAIMYFFPGFWKLYVSGFDWAFSDNLTNTLREKWLELGDWQPLVRADLVPPLCWAMALTTIAFELAFPILVLFRPTRLAAACVALAFHTGTLLLMNINYAILQLMYVSFIDWDGLLRRIRKTPKTACDNAAPPFGLVAVGATLLAVNSVLGFALIELSWPFACGPTFADMTGPETYAIRLYVKSAGAPEAEPFDDLSIRHRLRSERWQALIARIANEPEMADRESKFSALWDFLVRIELVSSNLELVEVKELTIRLEDGAVMKSIGKWSR
jgi:hypothetical protein